MKNYLHTILAAIFLATITCCTQQTKANVSDSNDTITVKRLSKYASSVGACTIEVDYPICSDTTLTRYLLDVITAEIDSFNVCEHVPYRLTDYTEEALDTIIGACAWQMTEILDEEVRETAELFGEDAPFPTNSGSRRLELFLVAETPQCVSYRVLYEEFTGGAHGMYSLTPITISKSDGHRITQILRPEMEDQMQELLWEGLMERIEGNDSARMAYREELEQYLEYAYNNKSHLPLPQEEPWIAADGLHLQYQPYEICNWAMGAPEIVIPAEKARPFVSVEAATLLQ